MATTTVRGIPIVVTNLKGGVGKSTLSVTLADALSVRHRKVRLADLDPQQTAGNWIQTGKEKGNFAEMELVGREEANAENVDMSGTFERWLEECDYLIIDTPAGGTLSRTTQQCIVGSDLVLVPFEATTPAITSMLLMTGFLVQAFQQNPHLRVWLIPNRVRNTREQNEGLEAMEQYLAENPHLSRFMQFAPLLHPIGKLAQRHAMFHDRTVYQATVTEGTTPASRRANDAGRMEVDALVEALLHKLEGATWTR